MTNRIYQSSQTNQRGFTLIELLIVIAIIAILASILFPVFAQAREKARATACLSNAKQMGIGLMQYSQDYDETLPIANYGVYTYPDGTISTGANKPDQPKWMDLIYAYVQSTKVFTCPSAQAFSQAYLESKNQDYHSYVYQGPDKKTRGTYNYGTYTLNGAYYKTNYFRHSPAGAALSAIVDTSGTIFITERGGANSNNNADISWIDDSVNPYVDTSSFKIPALRNNSPSTPQPLEYMFHLGGDNNVFCDGHAKWLTASQLVETHLVNGKNICYRWTVEDD